MPVTPKVLLQVNVYSLLWATLHPQWISEQLCPGAGFPVLQLVLEFASRCSSSEFLEHGQTDGHIGVWLTSTSDLPFQRWVGGRSCRMLNLVLTGAPGGQWVFNKWSHCCYQLAIRLDCVWSGFLALWDSLTSGRHRPVFLIEYLGLYVHLNSMWLLVFCSLRK